jgi:hypothetical protein
VLLANPDAVPSPAPSRAARFAERIPLAASPAAHARLDGELVPSRRRFPTVRGTLVRRTPLRRFGRRSSGSATTTTSARSRPSRCRRLAPRRLRAPPARDARRARRPRRRFRLYGEDIDSHTAAAKAGWERWYVPGAVVHHEWKRETDARFSRGDALALARLARFVRKHPETLARL